MRVAVVGGGLAGIAAAIELSKSPNVSVTLFESKNRLGGRAGSFRAKGTEPTIAEEVDYCQHVGMGCCRNLRELIEELGHRDYWEVHRDLHFYGPDGKHQILGSLPALPAPLHIAPWLFKWPGLNWRDRVSIARGMLKIRRERLEDSLDELPAIRWLESAGQTEQAIRQFWSTIIVSALGEHLESVSMASVCKVLQDGFLNSRDAYHLVVPKRPLNFLFNEEVQRYLNRHGVEIRLGQQVRNISEGKSGAVLNCTMGDIVFDRVILAMPWYALSKLSVASELPDLERELTPPQRLSSSPITGIHTWWDRPWLDTPHAVIVGRFCQWVFPKPDIEQHDTPQETNYYQIVVSASHALKHAPPDDFAAMLHDDLAHVFPDVRAAKLEKYKVVTDPNAVFSVTPGALKLRAEIRPIHDRFVLAGDWTRTGWPSTMEGAIISGTMAAKAIQQHHPNNPNYAD